MKSLFWEKEKHPHGSVYPNAREGHTLTYVPPLRSLIMFGGILNVRFNEVYLYDLDKKVWSVQTTSGRQPAGRCYHTAFFEDPYYFVYGGQGDKNRSLKDFYFLNIKNWTWKRLFIMESPPARHYHSMSDILNTDKEKIIFGGANSPDNILLNDVWIVNYSNVAFNSPLSEIPGTVCTPKKTKGDVPTPRKGHGAAVLGKSLVIYGGKTDDEEDTNWLYILYFDSWTWKKISGIAKPLTARSFFSYCMFEENKLFIFGGIDNESSKVLNDVYILRLEDFHWSAPFIAGHVPPPRYNNAACAFQLSNGEWDVYIQGGLENTYCPMDMYKLIETDAKQNVEWEKLEAPNYMDALTTDIAGSTILDQKNYISELEHIISIERSYGLELESDMKKLDEENSKEKSDHAARIKSLKDEINSLDNEYNTKFELTKNLFSMIPIEQLIATEIQNKNNLLEDVIQKTEGYLISLDKLYVALSKNKLDDNDPTEKKLKYVSESFKDEMSKSRDLHKGSLQHLKVSYDQYQELMKRSDTDIKIQRSSILDIEPRYEEILIESDQNDN